MKTAFQFAQFTFAACIVALMASPVAAQAPAPAARLATTIAPAAPPPVYGVLSLIGDEISVIASQLKSGDGAPTNFRRTAATDDGIFDTMAVRVTGEAIRQTRPGADLAVLNTRSPALFARQRELFDERDGVISIPQPILEALAAQGANRLILITKFRDDTRQLLTGSAAADDRLEGLGFFLDGTAITKDAATGSTGRGYISPFTYFKLTLVDLPSRKVLGSRAVARSEPFSAARAPSGDDPWAALSSAEKIQAIEALLRREIARALPQVLEGEKK